LCSSPSPYHHLSHRDAGSFSAEDHVCGTSTARERDHQVWLAFVEHLLIADRTSGLPVFFPVCDIDIGWHGGGSSPAVRHRVGASGTAVDHGRDGALGVQLVERPIQQRQVSE
jgi:hypothetical protein